MVSFVDQMNTDSSMMPLPRRLSLAMHAAEALREAVNHGLWQEKLPGERELSRQLNISRPTLRTALAILEKEQLLQSCPGRRRAIVPHTSLKSPGQARGVRMLIPFPLQQAPQSMVYWIDKLRALLPATDCALEILNGSRYYSQQPGKALAELIRQMPTAAWIIVRTTEPTQRWFAEHQLPCVVAGSCYPGLHLPSVDYDNRAVAQHAASQLLIRGHQRIALFMQIPKLAGDFETEVAFEEALHNARNPEVSLVIARHDGTLEGMRRQLDRLLRLRPAPTGFFVLHAIPSLALASELTRRGLRMPGDVSVISRDSDHFLGFFSPEIARYTYNTDLFARRLAGMVIQLAKEGSVPERHIRLMPTFIKGETLD